MNSLQIGLIAIGALVVAVLFLWHWWQSRAARRAVTVERTAQDLRVAPRVPADPVSGYVGGSDSGNLTVAPRVEHTMDIETAGVWTPRVSASTALHGTQDATPDFAVVLSPETVAPAAAPPEPAPAAEPSPPPVTPRPKLLSEWPFDERRTD